MSRDCYTCTNCGAQVGYFVDCLCAKTAWADIEDIDCTDLTVQPVTPWRSRIEGLLNHKIEINATFVPAPLKTPEEIEAEEQAESEWCHALLRAMAPEWADLMAGKKLKLESVTHGKSTPINGTVTLTTQGESE